MDLKFTYPIAIDMSDGNIYAAQLQETRQGIAAGGMASMVLKGEDQEELDGNIALISALKALSKDKRFTGKRAIAHLPAQHTSSFPIRFQLGKNDSMEETILKESKQHLPFPLGEAIIDYPSIIATDSGSTTQYRASVIAAHSDIVNRYLNVFKEAGLVLETVDFVVSSLIRLHQFFYDTSINPVILCHIGHSQSLLSVVIKDGILAERNISWGMNGLIKKLQTNLELPEGQNKAQILLEKYGLRHETGEETNDDVEVADEAENKAISRLIYQIITPYLEELLDEFHKMIGYLRSEEQNAVFEGIYIYGQGIIVQHFDRYIEKRLNLQTRLVDPMKKLDSFDAGIQTKQSDGYPFALALGLALRKIPWL